MAVGLITDAHQAEAIVAEGAADLVALASEMMYNPNWPVHAAHALGMPNYLDLLPLNHAFRLKRREDMRADYSRGRSVKIPHEVDEFHEYQWN
jgi:2,4-dienoyl-CoA reductase-like NADH-dependent reductase (Old Yellow Enzyme family)